jgi:hypothetical protein
MRRHNPTPSVRLDEHFALDLCKSRVRGLLLFLFLAQDTTALAIQPSKLDLAKVSETKALTLHYTSWVRSSMYQDSSHGYHGRPYPSQGC